MSALCQKQTYVQCLAFYLFPFWSLGPVRAADRDDIPGLLFLKTALADGVTHPNEVCSRDKAAADRGEYEDLWCGIVAGRDLAKELGRGSFKVLPRRSRNR
jgi:hypothetical protein